MSKVVDDPYHLFDDEAVEQQHLSNLYFIKDDIISAMNTIRPNAGARPNEFLAVLLRRCTEELATPLHMLYNHLLQTDVIPKLMKSARVTPLHKKGLSSLASNYRPIALT